MPVTVLIGSWDTVAGLIFNLLGHVPTEGETVVSDGHVLTAEKVTGRRISRVRIAPAAPDEAPGEPGRTPAAAGGGAAGTGAGAGEAEVG